MFLGASFTKTWRLKNVGTCTWTSGYELIFDSGDRRSAPDSLTLTGGAVPLGETVDVSVGLKAPGEAGTYQGYFKIRNPSGVVFDIGPAASGAFWVKIKATKLLLLRLTLFILPIGTILP
ncbi:MAG: NBR1-Ig-like domain-containing protein [Anaerolineales bacterium]|nr:NBR1-Ig-like domain-containing protein [Anaerolineales bacterium]